MSPLPVLGLDVDGVLALEGTPQVPALTTTVKRGTITRQVNVPECAAVKLAELARSFEMVWATTWTVDAHAAFREVLGLPVEPWPHTVGIDKLGAIRSHAAGRPWAWIDDTPEFLREDEPDPFDGVIVKVDPARGIYDVDPADLLRRVLELT